VFCNWLTLCVAETIVDLLKTCLDKYMPLDENFGKGGRPVSKDQQIHYHIRNGKYAVLAYIEWARIDH
jgi:hypothetical protein